MFTSRHLVYEQRDLVLPELLSLSPKIASEIISVEPALLDSNGIGGAGAGRGRGGRSQGRRKPGHLEPAARNVFAGAARCECAVGRPSDRPPGRPPARRPPPAAHPFVVHRPPPAVHSPPFARPAGPAVRRSLNAVRPSSPSAHRRSPPAAPSTARL